MYHAHLEVPPVTFWELGGTLYSFVGTALHGLPTFSLFYREHKDAQDILHPLEHFFTQVWGGFYAEAPPERYSLYGAYNSVLNLDKRLANEASSDGLLRVKGLPNPLLDPVSFVLEHCMAGTHPKTRLAITHGDLHGDNLFTDDDHLWVIDFERTGQGPILRDFVELEVDIVTRLIELPDHDSTLLLNLVEELTAPTVPKASLRKDVFENTHPEICKAMTIIEGLRTMAYDLGGCSDNSEYYWGLLLDALFVASLTTDQQPQRQRALVLAAALAEHLDRWEQA
jgi:hypothetical protein